ncbi:IS200/IS605 family transposase [candidate division KSB1 bacterium]|nr:MAG: IS200/IS605 family transposase [candidate division KSB1 bacterium]MBC6948214.1 IS200/IS605 family transposase [candidate division KSB1 bacterium]MCE7942422.1 IS200/IS605 family transposase [Chlorobi bacterium CHB1]MDL1874469.1 IS200/IS605 family transposase [Cytophagia bacterium CHB2]RIK59446.1 MAG: IS200/IS605 family transposase [candidate division KSB1 bacterium]
MANTYTQIYVHVVFTVQGRHNLIRKENKEELHKYLTGIIQNKGQKLIAINSMLDHVHIFIGMKPSIALSDLIRDVKNNSSNFINEKRWIRGKFNWQKGFGAFSYAHSQIDAVAKYILNQEKHHAKKTFKEEYVEMLKNFNVEYDEKYLFEFYELPEK